MVTPHKSIPLKEKEMRRRQLYKDEQIIREVLAKHPDIARINDVTIKYETKPCSANEPKRKKRKTKTKYARKKIWPCWKAEVVLKGGEKCSTVPSRFRGRQRLKEQLSKMRFLRQPYQYDIVHIKSKYAVRKYEDQMCFEISEAYGYKKENIRARMITSENVSARLGPIFKKRFRNLKEYFFFVFLGVEKSKGTFQPFRVAVLALRDIKDGRTPIWWSGDLLMSARLNYIDRDLQFELRSKVDKGKMLRTLVHVRSRIRKEPYKLYASELKRKGVNLDLIPGTLVWLKHGVRLSREQLGGFYVVVARCHFSFAKESFALLKICLVQNIGIDGDIKTQIKWVRRSIAKRYSGKYPLVERGREISEEEANTSFRMAPLYFVLTAQRSAASQIDAYLKRETIDEKNLELTDNLKRKGVEGHSEFRFDYAEHALQTLLQNIAKDRGLLFGCLNHSEQDIKLELIRSGAIDLETI